MNFNEEYVYIILTVLSILLRTWSLLFVFNIVHMKLCIYIFLCIDGSLLLTIFRRKNVYIDNLYFHFKVWVQERSLTVLVYNQTWHLFCTTQQQNAGTDQPVPWFFP